MKDQELATLMNSTSEVRQVNTRKTFGRYGALRDYADIVLTHTAKVGKSIEVRTHFTFKDIKSIQMHHDRKLRVRFDIELSIGRLTMTKDDLLTNYMYAERILQRIYELNFGNVLSNEEDK